MDLQAHTCYRRIVEASENFDLKELIAIHNEAVADVNLRQKTVITHSIANTISHNLIDILQHENSTPASTIRTEIEDTAMQVLAQLKSPKYTEEYDLPGHDILDKKIKADKLRVLMQKSLGKIIENFLMQDLQQKVAAIQKSLLRIGEGMSCVPFEDFLDTLIPHDYTDHGITQEQLLQEALSASTPQYVRIWMDRLTEGETQMEKELYGTLCVDCLLIVNRVFTVLDDGENRGVVLAIDITRSPQSQQCKFPLGLKVVIRNPHLVRTKNGCLCIWIDNPDYLVPVPSIPQVPAATDLFMEGIRGFEIGDMDTAIHLFTRALNSLRNISHNDSENMKDLFELHFHRANAYIKKMRYANALADALVLQRNGDARHQILMAQLLEVAENYEEAYLVWKLLFDKGLPDLDRHRPDMERCRDLYILKLRQQFKRYLSMPRSTKMVARSSFVGPIEIRVSDESSKSEWGLFITQDCMAGELVLVCDPVVDTMKEDEMHLGLHRLDAPTNEEAEELYHKLVVEMNRSHVLRKRIRTLFSARKSAPDIHLYWPEKYEERRSELDVQEEIKEWPGGEALLQDWLRLYATGVQYPNKNEPSEAENFCGLYLLPGFINHSCTPSASRFYVGKSMFVTAARDMKPGEEITLSYVCAIHSVWERKEMLSEWGINDCHCSRCKFELDTSDFMNVYGTEIYETFPAPSQEITSGLVPQTCRSVVKRFKSMLKNLGDITPMEREWLLASHQHSLLSGAHPELYKSTGEMKSNYKEASVDYRHDGMWGRLEVLQAIQATVPGHPYIVQMLVREAELIYAMNDKLGSLGLIDSTLNMARNAFSTVYGNLENAEEALRGISRYYNRENSIEAMEKYGVGASHQNSCPHQPDIPSHKDVRVESSRNQAGTGKGKGKPKKKQRKTKQKKH